MDVVDIAVKMVKGLLSLFSYMSLEDKIEALKILLFYQMGPLVSALTVIGVFKLASLTNKDQFKQGGMAHATCREVRIETYYEELRDSGWTQGDGDMPLDAWLGMGGKKRGDGIRYRIYVDYEWEGTLYTAKSYHTYSYCEVSPGDGLEVWVNKGDKSVVDVIHWTLPGKFTY